MVENSWYIRKGDIEDFKPIKVYGANPNLFSLKIHHGGVFTKSPGKKYINGKVSFVDMIDGDLFSVPELKSMMEELGYVGKIPMCYHFMAPDSANMDVGIKALANDQDVLEMLKYAALFKVLDVYTEQKEKNLQNVVQKSISVKLPCKKALFKEQGNDTDNPFNDPFFNELIKNDFCGDGGTNVETGNGVGQGSGTNVHENDNVQSVYDVGEGSLPNVNTEAEIENEFEGSEDREGSSDSGDDSGEDSGEDSDFIVDDVVDMHDFEVDMTNFKNNIDEEVEWIGCKDNPSKVSEAPMEAETLDLDKFDSGTDSNDDDDPARREALKRLRQQHNTNPNKKAHFFPSQTFGTKAEIKELIALHSIETRRHLHIIKDDKTRVRVICRGSIPVFSEPTDPNLTQPTGSNKPTDPKDSEPNKPTTADQTLPSARGNLKPRLSPQGIKWYKVKGKNAVGGKGPGTKGTKVGENIKKVDPVKKAVKKAVGGSKQITCPWVLHISKGVDQDTWMVKTLKETHKCLQARDLRKCTAGFLAKEIEEQIAPNQKLQAGLIRYQLQKKYEVAVSKHKIYRANKQAKGKIMGDYTEQYRLLRDYLLELQAKNPGTTVKLGFESEPNPDVQTRQFKRIYICLGALKRGFQACGRDLLGVDGCFMKGMFPGQLLTAVGVDPNNQIYPLAYGIVESESRSSWTWFLSCLGEDLGLDQRSNFTFISDRQKGIIPAIEELFPAAEHRFCLKHIYDNMKSSWRGQLYKDFIWKLATATTVEQFNKTMQDLKKVNKDAYEWLQKIPARHWTRSHFSGRSHCDVLLNNMCEVLNRQLVDGRDKPVILALEYTREYLMKRIVIVQKEIDKCNGSLTPMATVLFDAIKTEAAKYKATWNGDNEYQVVGPWLDQCVVDMEKKTCSCRKWELTGMPCKHAVSAMWDAGDNERPCGIPESYVHRVYWLNTWKEMYKFKISPVTGRTYWPKSDSPITILPPKHHVQIGRPKKKRRKSKAELEMVRQGKLSREGKTVKCGNCKERGHNKRGCTNPSKVSSGKSKGVKAKKARVE